MTIITCALLVTAVLPAIVSLLILAFVLDSYTGEWSKFTHAVTGVERIDTDAAALFSGCRYDGGGWVCVDGRSEVRVVDAVGAWRVIVVVGAGGDGEETG
jgi:hypothetical protein